MKQLEEGIDFYYNEKGLMVLTAQFHLERGYCCGNGCRHCPFNYERVAEPRRSVLRSSSGHPSTSTDKPVSDL